MRRTFVVASIACAVFAMAAMSVWLSLSPPATSRRAEWYKVVGVGDLPSDGHPRRYMVFASEVTSSANGASDPVGAVFVRRDPVNGTVSALQAVHCHGPMQVLAEYDAATNCYRSCCWKVRFDLEGHEIADDEGRSMGDCMPPVPVRIDNDQVFVQISDRPCDQQQPSSETHSR